MSRRPGPVIVMRNVVAGRAWTAHRIMEWGDVARVNMVQLRRVVHTWLTGEALTYPAMSMRRAPGRGVTVYYRDGAEFWPKYVLAALTGQSGLPNPAGRAKPQGASLYESFHESPPKSERSVPYKEPGQKIIKIGRLTEIKYRPEPPSKHTGIEFYHKAGDLGHRTIKSNAILATNEDGSQLYIVREDPAVHFPVFSARGILG